MEAGFGPLYHPRAGSYNCSGRVQSGTVFVSALISTPCLAFFIDMGLQLFVQPFIWLLKGSLFSSDLSEFKLEF